MKVSFSFQVLYNQACVSFSCTVCQVKSLQKSEVVAVKHTVLVVIGSYVFFTLLFTATVFWLMSSVVTLSYPAHC